jgi:Right handed beta helix region
VHHATSKPVTISTVADVNHDHSWGSWGHQHRHPPTTVVTPTTAPTPSVIAVPTTIPTTKPTRPTTPVTSSTTSSSSGSGSSGSGSAPAGVPRSGVPAGTNLTAMNSLTITQAGTVIDSADIRGGVTIQASNVTIKNSKIEGNGDYGVYVRSGSLTLQDSTVTGFDNSVAGDNYTADRVEVTQSQEDGFKIGDNVTIENSYCHDLVVAPGAHSDCGQVQSGVRNAVIRGNWFDIGNKNGNSALFLAPDLGPSSPGPLIVEDNVLGGGNFTLQCVDGDNGRYFISNITISGNSFLSNSYYGPMRVNVTAKISGNVMKGTSKVVNP